MPGPGLIVSDAFPHSTLKEHLRRSVWAPGQQATVDPTDTRFAGGAKGDATAAGTGTEDTAAFQAAGAYLESIGGGVLAVPPPPGGGGYLLDDVTFAKPVRVVCVGSGQDIATRSGSELGLTTFVKKPGSGVGAIFNFASATTGAYLSGCGVYFAKFILNSIGQAVFLDQVEDSEFVGLWCSAASGDFVDPDNKRGIFTLTNGTRFCTFRDITAGTTKEAAAFFLDGEGAVAGCTQNDFQHIRVAYGGSGGDGREGGIVLHGNVDHNYFRHIHAYNDGTLPGTSGTYGIVLREGATYHARHNRFHDLTARVYEEDGCYGNEFTDWTSEASGYYPETAGQPASSYTVVDFGHARRYETPTYTMRDRLILSAGDLSPTSPAVHSNAVVGIGASVSLGQGEVCAATIPAPYLWPTGDVASATIEWGVGSGTEGHTWDCRLEIATTASGEVPADKNSAADLNIALPATPGGKAIRTNLTVTGVDFSEGDTIQVRITHVAGSSGTPHAGDIEILGLQLEFQADGPETSGGGPFGIPARST